MEKDTIRAYNGIAQIMGNADMQTIFDIFVEKILQNLIYTDGSTEDGKLIIDFSLDTFDAFVQSPVSCRLMCKSSLVI